MNRSDNKPTATKKRSGRDGNRNQSKENFRGEHNKRRSKRLKRSKKKKHKKIEFSSSSVERSEEEILSSRSISPIVKRKKAKKKKKRKKKRSSKKKENKKFFHDEIQNRNDTEYINPQMIATPMGYLTPNHNPGYFRPPPFQQPINSNFMVPAPQFLYSTTDRGNWNQLVIKKAQQKNVYKKLKKRKNKPRKRRESSSQEDSEDESENSSSSEDEKIHYKNKSQRKLKEREKKRDKVFKETMKRIQRLKNLDESLNLRKSQSRILAVNEVKPKKLKRNDSNFSNGNNQLFALNDEYKTNNSVSVKGNLQKKYLENFKRSLKKLHEKIKDPLEDNNEFSREFANTTRYPMCNDDKILAKNIKFSEKILKTKYQSFVKEKYFSRPKNFRTNSSSLTQGNIEDPDEYRIIDREDEEEPKSKKPVKMFIDFQNKPKLDKSKIPKKLNFAEKSNFEESNPTLEKYANEDMTLAEAFKTRKSKVADRIETDRIRRSLRAKSKPVSRIKQRGRNSLYFNRTKAPTGYRKSSVDNSRLKTNSVSKKKFQTNPVLERLSKGEKVKISKKEMQELTMRNYKKLPEVKKRKKELNRMKEFLERQKKVKLFSEVSYFIFLIVLES